MSVEAKAAPFAGPAAAEKAYRLEEHIGFVLRKANQRHLALFSARISDLTPPQFAALARLEEVGEASQNQLGGLIAMDAATIKGVIDRLKARGLVEIDTHKEDRRRLVVRLSAEGRDTLARLRLLAFAITEETLAPLTGRERASLMRLLAKIG